MMTYSVYGLPTYYSAFISPFKSYQVSPVTNLVYGVTASKIYSQTVAKNLKSAMSSYLTSLNSSVTSLRTAAENLASEGPDSIFSQRSVSSSDDGVTAIANPDADLGSYTLNISKLATAQVNIGNQLNSNDNSSFTLGTNTFLIKTGSIEKEVSFTVEEGDTNKSILNKMANSINSAGLGITASVTSDPDSGISYIKVVSNNTGTDSSFTLTDIQGNAVAVSGADSVKTKAQDSEYTVDGKQYTSQTNSITLNNGKVYVTFSKAEGKDIELTVGPDTEAIKEGIKEFAESYNNTLGFIRTYSYQFSGLQRLHQELVNITGYKRYSLQSIGININMDGTLFIEDSKLENAINDRLSYVKDIFSGYNGVAERVYTKAEEVLGAPLKYTSPADIMQNYSHFYSYFPVAPSLSSSNQNPYTGLLLNLLL